MSRSLLAPPVSPNATCGTLVAGQEKNWAAPAPWKRVFSHHPSEWSWLRQYPAGTNLRFCQYTARVTGTQPEISYTAEVVTLNPTPAQLVTWMASACRTAIQATGAPPDRFDDCVRGLYWGQPLQAADDKKKFLGIRQFSGGQFVVAGAVTLDQSRGGVVCHRDGVALLRERPGLPAIGYFVLTETADGRTAKQVTDGELAECFKIGAPKEWPGGSAAQPAGTTRDQFWNALPKLGRTPAEFGLSTPCRSRAVGGVAPRGARGAPGGAQVEQPRADRRLGPGPRAGSLALAERGPPGPLMVVSLAGPRASPLAS